MADVNKTELKSEPIPPTFLNPTAKQNAEHAGFKKIAYWAFGLVIVWVAFSTFFPKGFGDSESTPDQTAAYLLRHPTNYGRNICLDDSPAKPEDRDISNVNLPLGAKMTVTLKDNGCFVDGYALPSNRIYRVQKSNAQGDWAAIFCNRSDQAPTQVQPANVDMEQSLSDCHAGGRIAIFPVTNVDSSIRFSLQGKGTITFIVTDYKTVFGS